MAQLTAVSGLTNPNPYPDAEPDPDPNPKPVTLALTRTLSLTPTLFTFLRARLNNCKYHACEGRRDGSREEVRRGGRGEGKRRENGARSEHQLLRWPGAPSWLQPRREASFAPKKKKQPG